DGACPGLAPSQAAEQISIAFALLHLFLGGAALQRCDCYQFLRPASAAAVRLQRYEDAFSAASYGGVVAEMPMGRQSRRVGSVRSKCPVRDLRPCVTSKHRAARPFRHIGV